MTNIHTARHIITHTHIHSCSEQYIWSYLNKRQSNAINHGAPTQSTPLDWFYNPLQVIVPSHSSLWRAYSLHPSAYPNVSSVFLSHAEWSIKYWWPISNLVQEHHRILVVDSSVGFLSWFCGHGFQFTWVQFGTEQRKCQFQHALNY